MAVDINYPISIEFYGLPGCGKSTISHSLASELRNCGLLVWEPSYDIDRKYSSVERKLVKMFRMVCFAITHTKSYHHLSSLVAQNGYTGLAALNQKANLIYKVSAYFSRKKFDVMIWDEGLIQSSISLSINGMASSLNNEMCILQYGNRLPIHKVFVKVDNETSLARMNSRTSHESRVEKLTSIGDKLKMLQLFESSVKIISSNIEDGCVNSLIVDGSTVTLGQIRSTLRNEFLRDTNAQ